MNLNILIMVISCIAAIASAVSAVYVSMRDQRWRDSDDFKALTSRIAAAEKQLAAGEERFRGLATKEDLAGIRAEVHALKDSLNGVDAGVIRIENFLRDRPR